VLASRQNLQQDVVRLDVAVHDLQLVQLVHALGDVLEHEKKLALLQAVNVLRLLNDA